MKIRSSKLFFIGCILSFSSGSFSSQNSSKDSIFGPYVYVLDPNTPDDNQAKINTVYVQQRLNEFGTNHYAILFKKGRYNADVKVGYNTQISGLGQSPDDVVIVGAVRTQDAPPVDPNHPDWAPGALMNFWRSIENLSVIPTLGSINYSTHIIPKDQNVWAVSQASPMRRIHVKQDVSHQSSGTLRLFEIGWSSGGFMANSKIDGSVISGSQQQWLSRNSEWGKQWQDGNWNTIDVGSIGPLPPHRDPNTLPRQAWTSYPFTQIAKTPVIAEKPFLVLDDAQNWSVFVPALQQNTLGVTWDDPRNPEKGISHPISEFYIAHPSNTADTINTALRNGKNVIFTPGVYHLSVPIKVTRANTILLGLGLPSLIPENGTQAILVSDVGGVKIAGIIVDAGPALSDPTLIQIGETTSNADHSNNPTSLYDVFCRVGGLSNVSVKTKSCLIINSNNVLADNLWIWRADHGVNPAAVGWNVNSADNGIIINGHNVTIYGLAVEHFQKTQTIWNGENGQVYFYQSETPYDPPSQNDWRMVPEKNGYPSYKINEHVKKHTAYGIGIYCYFRDAPNIYLDNAIEVPNALGISMNHLLTVWLNGNAVDPTAPSGIKNIIGITGQRSQGDSVISNSREGLKISTLDVLQHH